MAKPEMMIRINLEPSPETVDAAKMILELWVNAYQDRDILVKERYTEAGEKEIYLELKEGEAE